MTPEQEKRLEEISSKVTQIHGHLFGVNGHGSWLEVMDVRVNKLESKSEELSVFKVKMLAVVGAVSFVASGVGSKLAGLFK
jgi:hypothetical protein